MPKKSSAPTESIEQPLIPSFTLKRMDGGWAVIKFVTQGEKLVSVEKVSEPDMLPISQAKLIAAIMEVTK
jgi:hypothetical protein